MVAISVFAEAAFDIIAGITKGDLVISGVQIRDVASGKIKYVLDGADGLRLEDFQSPSLPDLGPLTDALSPQQWANAITVAQNAGLTVDLNRVEEKINQIARQLDGMDRKLSSIGAKVDLVLAGIRSDAMSRLLSAKNAAITAIRKDNQTSLIQATKEVEHAARQILAQALHLVEVEENGLPVALRCPDALAELLNSGADAMLSASVLHLALDEPDAAAALMRELIAAIEKIRHRLRQAFIDPELTLRRVEAKLASFAQISAAADALKTIHHWAETRTLLLAAGAIEGKPLALEFTPPSATPALRFVEVPESFAESPATPKPA